MIPRGVMVSWFRILSLLALVALSAGIAAANNSVDPVLPYQNSTQLFASFGNARNPALGPASSNNDARIFETMVVTGIAVDDSPELQSEGQLLDTPGYEFDCPPNAQDCMLVSTFNMPVVREVAQTVVVIDVNAVAQSESVPYHTPVPEPGSIVLLGSALAAFAGISWRQQKAE